MANLQTELKTYAERLPTLLGQSGKFVLIRGTELVATYDTYEDALKVGFEKFGLDAFLVKRIAPAEQVAFFTRDLQACPA